MRTQKWMAVLTLGLLVGITLFFVPGAAAQQFSQGPVVVPPDKQYEGLNYSEWAIKWWQWATLLPADANPLSDTTDCSSGQVGPVWFLGGQFCATDDPNCHPAAVVRSCTVPAGKALFFPIFNTEYSFIENAVGTKESDLRLLTKQSMDGVTNLWVFVDGQPIANVDRYRTCRSGTTCTPIQSPLFTYTLAPRNNLWAHVGEHLNNDPVQPLMPDGLTTEGVSDGYFILLEPLSPGRHTIRFHGELPQWGMVIDTTYNLRVLR